MPQSAGEANFDGLVGPTHNYAGLSRGNLASQENAGDVSCPRQAALQGLAKMKLLMDRGVGQAVLPPQDRPDVGLLRRLGFAGSDAQAIERAQRESPRLLASAASASAMWAANAATVSPSADCADGRLHLTPANLATNLHRANEAAFTTRVLRAIFADEDSFAVHDPLPACDTLADEGAANHTRLCAEHGGPGIELFHYGRDGADGPSAGGPVRHPARQSRAACQAIARRHGLEPARTFLIGQNPRAIDAGVFHNDVIAVGHRDWLLHHEEAYLGGPAALDPVAEAFVRLTGKPLRRWGVTEAQLPLAEAVGSYFFNSQIVDGPGGSMAMIAPTETQRIASTLKLLDELSAPGNPGSPGGPINAVEIIDLRQSMRNGGGPACLRLRVVLTEKERARMLTGVFLTPELHGRLVSWVERHYREELSPGDLADPKLLEESRAALDALTGLLGSGSIYDFQRST